jgi:hypothetical protein
MKVHISYNGDIFIGPHNHNQNEVTRQNITGGVNITLNELPNYNKNVTTIIPMIPKKTEGNKCTNKLWTECMEVPFIDGTIIGYYKGCLLNGIFHGKGTINYKTGNIYTGDFFGGQRHGNGTYIDKNGSTFNGKWKNGYFISGEEIYKNGDKIKGKFYNWMPYGKCILTLSNDKNIIKYFKNPHNIYKKQRS